MERTQAQPSTAAPAVPDTLARPHHTAGRNYRSGDLEQGRTAVLRDLGTIPVVSMDYFESAVLPPLPPTIDIEKIKHELELLGIIDKSSGRWAKYEKDPKDDKEGEGLYYRRLVDIFTAVIAEAENQTETKGRLDFIAAPTVAPISDRSNTSRPDAFLLLKDDYKKSVVPPIKGQHRWDDIAVTFEFKKSSEADHRRDNDRKAVWSAHHIMRSDPCRRFNFAVTIEGVHMRLWFTCRAVTFVSRARDFNFITDTTRLIRFLCSLSFCKDHELGWDPSVKRVLVDNVAQFDITLQPPNGGAVEYRTTKTLADFGAEAMKGRGTRVFQAFDKTDPGETPVVIKDSWRDTSRKREDVILNEILADIERTQGAAKATEAREYFLTIIDAVDVSVEGHLNSTSQLLRGTDLPSDCRTYTLPFDDRLSRTPHGSSSGRTPSSETKDPGLGDDALKITHRLHNRIVFKEVCTTLPDVRDLGDVLKMLIAAVKGLRILHDAGWVHRDFSPGNLLKANAGGVTKIGDLEYAKQVDSNETHGIRTGTMNFMACEVEGQRYLFCKALQRGPDPKRPAISTPAVNPSKSPFRANPLHDMESLWWTFTWVLHYHVDEDGKIRPEKQGVAYNSLFPGTMPSDTRVGRLMTELEIDTFPAAFGNAVTWAEGMRRELLTAYIACEDPSPPDYKPHISELSQYFVDALEVSLMGSSNVKLYRPAEQRKSQPTSSDGSRPSKRMKVD